VACFVAGAAPRAAVTEGAAGAFAALGEPEALGDGGPADVVGAVGVVEVVVAGPSGPVSPAIDSCGGSPVPVLGGGVGACSVVSAGGVGVLEVSPADSGPLGASASAPPGAHAGIALSWQVTTNKSAPLRTT
jgi:hypothetical protein